MGRVDVANFASLLWAISWSGERECCTHTYISVHSSVVVQNLSLNHYVLAVRTYFETKCIAVVLNLCQTAAR
jgi:hypothetical protein